MHPVPRGDTTLVAAPLFHGLGLFNANLALALGSTLILRARFQPIQTLDDIQTHRVVVFVAVPVMLQRILALPKRQLESYDTSSLRIVISGGAALPGDLAERFMDRFGPVLYNVYGSTETALATIASPQSLRRAPGTAGHPTPGRGCASSTATATARAPEPRAGSSSAVAYGSTATPAVAARTSSTGCSRQATSATSTDGAGCSSTGVRTR